MSRVLFYILACIIAYLLGSVSTGILVSKFSSGPDLRTVGSKSTGASNVQRTMGWRPGLITFCGDCLKAILACLIGRWITGSHMGCLAAGMAAVIGHNWPVFFGFKGGKGVASSCGVMIVCYPIPALISYAFAILIIWLTKFISVGSMCLLSIYAVLVSVFCSGGDWRIILWAVALAVLCIIRHHANIDRLIHGNENKLGTRVKV